MATDKKPRMSFDEAMDEIADIARNGDGADKFRALKMVTERESSGATLPPPMSAEEIVERLTRLMRASGSGNCQIAFRKAFSGTRRNIGDAMPDLALADISPFEKSALPRTLRQLYKQFPEIKRSGYPAGYPRNKGLEAQMTWCQKKATEILRTREENLLNNLDPDATVKHIDGPARG